MDAILDMRIANSVPVEVPGDLDPHEFAKQMGFKSKDDYEVIDLSPVWESSYDFDEGESDHE